MRFPFKAYVLSTNPAPGPHFWLLAYPPDNSTLCSRSPSLVFPEHPAPPGSIPGCFRFSHASSGPLSLLDKEGMQPDAEGPGAQGREAIPNNHYMADTPPSIHKRDNRRILVTILKPYSPAILFAGERAARIRAACLQVPVLWLRGKVKAELWPLRGKLTLMPEIGQAETVDFSLDFK